MTYEELSRILESRPPGPKPFFTAAHLIRYLELVQMRHFGRKELAQRLKLGEGSVRTITDLLRARGLVNVVRAGVKLSEAGAAALDSIRKEFSEGQPVPASKAVVGEYNVAIAVRGGGRKVTSGLEQRDAAMIAGSKGASTFVYSSGRLVFPGMYDDLARLDPELSKTIIEKLPLKEGDAVVVGSASDPDAAFIGAVAAAATLL